MASQIKLDGKLTDIANLTKEQIIKYLCIYRKNIEVTLATANKDYLLDKFQNLIGKPINKLILPNFNAEFYAIANFGGTGTYLTNPQSPSGKPIANIEAIDGAYLVLVNNQNQRVADEVPLMLYRQDPEFFGEKGLFADKPCIDWTQTKVFYPSLDIPNAEDGNSIQIIVEYYDVYKE